ncbi:hypothetical protein [Peribacillus asahii]|uniref:hypothetical protein n=1 Tax=Peribacillus asahii TaxID=228899 RepID=UPI00381337E4
MTNKKTLDMFETLVWELQDAIGFMETFSSMPESLGCACEAEDLDSEDCICVTDNGIKRITDKEGIFAEAQKLLEEMKKEKTFEQELSELIDKHAKRSEETAFGHLIELENKKFIQLDLIEDSNDLEEFKKREDEEVEEDDEDEVPEEIHLCNECDEMHYDPTDTCEYCPSESMRVVNKGDLGFY